MSYKSGDFRDFDPSTPAERMVMFLLEELSAISDKLDVIIEGQAPLPVIPIKPPAAKVEVPAVAPSLAPAVPKAADRFKRR